MASTNMHAYLNYVIEDVMISSAYNKSNRDKAKQELRNNGCNVVWDVEMCENVGWSSYYVYMGCRLSSATNVNQNHTQNAITGIMVLKGAKQNEIVYKGKKYHPIKSVNESNGDVNQYKGSHTEAYVYITRDGNQDIDVPILKELSVTRSKSDDSSIRVGGGEWKNGSVNINTNCFDLDPSKSVYFSCVWHSHNKTTTTISATQHSQMCDLCGLVSKDNKYIRSHTFNFYKEGQTNKSQHTEKCTECTQTQMVPHDFSSYSTEENKHSKVCSLCTYLLDGEHSRSLKQNYIAVDETNHLTMCEECSYHRYESHSLGSNPVSTERMATCSMEGIAVYKCTSRGCDKLVKKIMPRLSHNYNSYGICTNRGCTNPYQPAESVNEGGVEKFSIANAGNLAWFTFLVNAGDTRANAVLTADIPLPDGYPFEPIGKTSAIIYEGKFEGENHIISNLRISSDNDYQAFFGFVGSDAEITSINITDVAISAASNAAVIVASNRGLVKDCSVSNGTITTTKFGSCSGGVCAANSGEIQNCSVGKDLKISTDDIIAGGVCGLNTNTISNNTTYAIDFEGNLLPEVGSGDSSITDTNQTRGAFYLETLSNTEVDDAVTRASIEAFLTHFLLNEETGIQSINVQEEKDSSLSSHFDIFDLQGRVVRKHAPAANPIQGLNPGIYIMNGKKVIVR